MQVESIRMAIGMITSWDVGDIVQGMTFYFLRRI